MPTRSANFVFSVLFSAGVASFCGTLHAQGFQNIPSIAFTKVAGGADPLPQVLSAAATGVPFTFTFAATTQSGGNWLSASSALNCVTCTTPNVVIAKVTTSPSLGAGSYSGRIVLTASGGALTVNITLTVAPAGGTFFDSLPGQLSFTKAPGGGSPPGQRIQIRNGGTGTLTWNLTASTFNGGNWLNVSAASGTAPTLIDVSVSTPSLPGGGLTAGTFIGQLSFTAAGSSVTIPISVVVGANVFRQVNPINFTKPYAGADPLPQILTIASAGADFNFSFDSTTSTGGNWLSLSSPGNCNPCTTPAALAVSVRTSSVLAPGTYTGEIVMTDYLDPASSLTVAVTLTVGPPVADFFDDVPGQLTFSLVTGGGNPALQTVSIRDFGAGFLAWNLTAITADGGNWLNVLTSTSGTAPSLVNVGIQVSNLPGAGLVAGTFIAQLFFQANGSSVTIPVCVLVGPNVFSQVNPISFTKPNGGADPLPQTLTIASTTALSFTFTSSTATGGDWLTVSSALNCVACTTPNVLSVAVTSSPMLSPGTYTGQIILTSSEGPPMSMAIPVTLTVAPIGNNFFDNLPGQLTFSLQTGTTNPPGQNIQIRNVGAGGLNWTLTAITADGGNWLAASALTGTAPSTLTISVAVRSLPGAGLAAGTFVGELFFQTPGSSITVPVNVLVGASVFSQINPISFTKPYSGADPLPQILTIASTGDSFNFSFTSSTSTGGDWLSLSSAVNCGACAIPNVIAAAVKASPTLPPGTYTGQIVLTSYSNPAISMTVPVSLKVSAAGDSFFDNVQGQLSFVLTPGSGTPASQIVQLRNGGAGSLSWSATAETSDGGNWITLSQASGSAPAAVTVGVATQSLPASGAANGVYTGEITFVSDSGAVITVPVVVQIGLSVFTPPAALSFTKPLGASNALAQTFTVNSTGGAFAFTAASFSGNGGNWLSVSADDGCAPCATPDSLTATVTSAASMPAGSYTGEIVLTSYSDPATAITVPVTLAVEQSPFTLTPLSAPSPAAGGVASVTITANSPSAGWTAITNSSFISVTAGTSGTGNGTVSYSVTPNTGPPRAGTITIAGLTYTVTQGGSGHPSFFAGEASLGSGVYYLQFPNGNLFGYYNYQFFPPIFFHYDMGFEAFIDANDAPGDAYLYDYGSGHWFYTGPGLFPSLYDFTLNSWVYYFPDTSNTGHYTANPRYFANLTTGKIFSM